MYISRLDCCDLVLIGRKVSHVRWFELLRFGIRVRLFFLLNLNPDTIPQSYQHLHSPLTFQVSYLLPE